VQPLRAESFTLYRRTGEKDAQSSSEEEDGDDDPQGVEAPRAPPSGATSSSSGNSLTAPSKIDEIAVNSCSCFSGNRSMDGIPSAASEVG